MLPCGCTLYALVGAPWPVVTHVIRLSLMHAAEFRFDVLTVRSLHAVCKRLNMISTIQFPVVLQDTFRICRITKCRDVYCVVSSCNYVNIAVSREVSHRDDPAQNTGTFSHTSVWGQHLADLYTSVLHSFCFVLCLFVVPVSATLDIRTPTPIA